LFATPSGSSQLTKTTIRGKLRRVAQFYDAAESWSRVERIIARVEAGPKASDARFIVTNLEAGRARRPSQRLYCARGQRLPRRRPGPRTTARPGKTTSPPQPTIRTSCHTAEANQCRRFLHAGAYWLILSMRHVMAKRSVWRVVQFDTLRLRLIKLATRDEIGLA
jgi:hypothetical protein